MSDRESDSLLAQLLGRGDHVEIVGGRLKIISASGKEIPENWLKKHRRGLIIEIATLVGAEVFEYLYYTTGNYPVIKGRKIWRGGVTLQLQNLKDCSSGYIIFNAMTKRARSTKFGKKDEPLPEKQFRITRKFKFYKFWRSTGLPVPRRLSAFHDYMGNLADIVFTGIPGEGESLIDIHPVNITHEILIHMLSHRSPNDSLTTQRQAPDYPRTTLPDKKGSERQQFRGLERNRPTGEKRHGNEVTRENGYSGIPNPVSEQSNEEWLAEFNGASYRSSPETRH